jgi:hypothetical protein
MRGRSTRRSHTAAEPRFWYERDGGARLEADRVLVAASPYATLTYGFDPVRRRYSLEGPIVYQSDSGIQTRVTVRIVFPNDYPRREPRVYDPVNRFVHDADGHFLPDKDGDGRCCLWLDWETEWDSRNPGALLQFIDQVALFFYRQLIFEERGRTDWPGPAREHGVHGYYEFLKEQLRANSNELRGLLPALENYGLRPRFGACPCGSGHSYEECHLDDVKRLVDKVGRRELERRIAYWRRSGFAGPT